VEPDSPVAKFWLGISLIGKGQEKPGREFLLSAVNLNPYVASRFIESHPASEARAPVLSIENATFDWTAILLSKPVLKKLPKTRRRRLRVEMGSNDLVDGSKTGSEYQK
jgi:hypothetical protein